MLLGIDDLSSGSKMLVLQGFSLRSLGDLPLRPSVTAGVGAVGAFNDLDVPSDLLIVEGFSSSKDGLYMMKPRETTSTAVEF